LDAIISENKTGGVRMVGVNTRAFVGLRLPSPQNEEKTVETNEKRQQNGNSPRGPGHINNERKMAN
jgi:hypothetical protein